MAQYIKTEEGYKELATVTDDKMDKTNPTGTGSFSMNRKAGTVIGGASHAEGYDTTASGYGSHAEGNNTTASGGESHAEGDGTTASQSYSHAEGNRTTASGQSSHAEGSSTTAIGYTSHAEGTNTTASGNYSHAEGFITTASGDFSHAEGYRTTASGYNSHAEGNQTTVSGRYSHAEGNSTNKFSSVVTTTNPTTDDIINVWKNKKFSVAKGDCSHVEGEDNLALGDYSHAEGCQTTANEFASHAEGGGTTANGFDSHAEGGGTTASGYYSHAEGNNTTASGQSSHAEGFDTTASGNYSHVQGKYNIEDTSNKYADIIGNGTITKRSNATTVDWKGNAWFAGDVYTGSTSGTNKDNGSKKLATEEYVNNSIAAGSIQPDWNQNDETKKDYIKNRPGGYIGETAPTLTLNINATKQDGINKLTDVKVTTDNFIDENSINISIDNGYTMIHRMLTQRFIPGYVINEYGATIYGNAHLIDASQPDTGEDLAMYKDDFGESAYGIGWHIWATSIPSGDFNVFVEQKSTYTVPFQSKFIPWEASPTATSILYTEQSLTDGQQAQARANIGAGTPYTLPQATAEALGGVKADSAEAADTQPVRIGGDGKLYTTPSVTDISTKMDANNPVGTGSFSMNRKAHTVIGINSHAEGSSTTASGRSSHAEGNSTTASGDYSHAEGFSTTANVVSAHAEGSSTTASGGSSHAEGNRTTASGGSSHAEGNSTTASGDYSHVQGKYNIEDSSSIYADIIGNGTSNTARSNATTVDWNGNAWFAGDVYTGSTSGTNKDEGSKKLATEEYVNNSIAAGGTDISLGLTSAAVGQIIKVKAIDASGKPTAWEAADMQSGGSETWEKISDVSLTQDISSYILASFGSYRKIKIMMERGTYVSGLSKNVWVRTFLPGVNNAFYTVGYLTSEYGYLKWEVNTEVNNAFISGHMMSSNNPNASATLGWKLSKELGDTAVSDLSLRLDFTDVSVIQDGDSVSVWGVRW